MNFVKIESSIYILLLVPIFSFLWHFENNHLPMSDAVGYLESAYLIFNFYEQGEYLNFIVSIFNERGWRPVIFQLFLIPPMILSNGDLLISILLIHVFFNSLSALFLFKTFRLYLATYSSVILATILSLSFNIFFGGEQFLLFAEIAFIPFYIATIYYLIDPHLFENKDKTRKFTIFFSLAILTRPVEGIIFLLPALLFNVFAVNSKSLSLNQKIQGLIFPIFFLWLLFMSRIIPKISSSVIKIDPPYSQELFITLSIMITGLFISIILIFLLTRKDNVVKNNNSIFFKSMLYSSLVIWIWYTPRFGSLYGWVYDTSIGSQFNYLKNAEHNFYDLITNAVNNNGSLIIFISVSLLLVSVVHIILKNKFKLSELLVLSNSVTYLNMLILTSVFFPILLYFTTHQISYRKVAPVITILLVCVLIIIFQNIKLKKIFNTSFSIFLFLQVITLGDHIYKAKDNDKWITGNLSTFYKIVIGQSFPKPINIQENPHQNLMEFLKTHHEKKSYKKLGLVLNDSAYPIEPYLLKFLCLRNKIICTFSAPKNFTFDDFAYLNKNDAILVVDSNHYPLKISQEISDKIKDRIDNNMNNSSPSELYSYNIQYIYSSNKIDAYNFKVIECVNFYKKNVSCLIKKKEY